jgi:leucyl-tRNA synthetase
MAYNHEQIEKKWQKFWEREGTFSTKNPDISQKNDTQDSSAKAESNQTFHTENGGAKPKKYILDMFPYPSGAGLHVGHPKGYTATDIVSRFYHAKWYNVLHPMGFDAFGLPAENYAIKTGTHPAITTAENIETFISQLKNLGFSYDWNRMVDTTDPEYYKWTQWIFLELFKRGLAYEQDLPINYCPSCKTGLANEEVLSDNTCDRCGTRVERRPIRQWVLKITEYAERLIEDLDGLDWPEGIKEMQRNWIGKSEGCEFEMKKSDDASKSIRVYTTRVDTVFGMTYAVLAPDHPKVADFITPEQKNACEAYIEEAKSKSDQDRTAENKEKTGVWTGSYVINPYNGESVPLWIADYVLGHYGTGAVMAVPAHDERDFAFAKRYDLNIKNVIEPNEGAKKSGLFYGNLDWKYKIQSSAPWEFSANIELYNAFKNNEISFIGKHCWFLINSSSFDWLPDELGRQQLTQKAETEGFGIKKVNYKLRDWLFSRQRYWGEPIPLIHISNADFNALPRISEMAEATQPDTAYVLDKKWTDKRCKNCTCEEWCTKLIIGGKTFSKVYDGINGKIIIDHRLPLTLPEVERYEPAGDGQSPLATVLDWVNVKLAENLSGKRETNTMPQWGGSCWYYLRYMDNKNSDALAGKEALDYWGIVDEYVGGAEHAVLHLLYARFWHKVLYDAGIVPTKEPFQKLTNVGMILAYAYERADGGLVAVDLVEERDGKFFERETGKEVKQVVAKMSKSLKNVINPNDIVREYGADTLRLYEMNMAGFTDTAPWNPEAITGVRRFLDKAYSAFLDGKNIAKDDMKAMKLLHKTIKKVWEDIIGYKFNTAISSLMILLNEGIPMDTEFAHEWKEAFTILLHPFAPHMAEELYQTLGKNQSIYEASWPEYDEFMLVDDEVTIAVQVNGKLRGTLTCFNGVAQEEVSALAHTHSDIAKWLEGKTLVKEIFIPNKMLSIVVKD